MSGGRNGGTTKAKAFNGINSKRLYQTPVEFFSADTFKNSTGVLDKKGILLNGNLMNQCKCVEIRGVSECEGWVLSD